MSSGWQPGPGDWPSDDSGVPPRNGSPQQPADDSYAPGGDGRIEDGATGSPWGDYGASSWGAAPQPGTQPDPYGTAPSPFAGNSPYGDQGQQGYPSQGQQAPYGVSGPSVPSAGMPPAGYGGGGYGGGGYGGGDGYGGGYGPGPGAPKKSNLGLILGIVGALAVIGLIVGIVMMVTGGKNDPGPTPPPPGPTTPGPGPTTPGPGEEGEYGSDPEKDALWDSCAAGDMDACDDLWLYSSYDSGYWNFAVTCGGLETENMAGDCDKRHRQAYGDDPLMDVLWDSCAEGDWKSCDSLRDGTPENSEYYEFARTCGETEDNPGYAGCQAFYVFTFGDDPELDQLYTWCQEGDLGSCDRLYRQAQYGTDYHHFGDTCGATRTATYGDCDDDENNAYGEDRYLDTLWDACAAGDVWQCHMLTIEADYGTEYADWGDTCGDTTRSGECFTAGDGTFGSEPHLDELWTACKEGSMTSCDQLYRYSPWGTEYEEFGKTCGDTKPDAFGFCAYDF